MPKKIDEEAEANYEAVRQFARKNSTSIAQAEKMMNKATEIEATEDSPKKSNKANGKKKK